jgi:DNA-binding CsgD family transcriptional regulator
MRKAVIIIHPAEIVRKGLSAILEDFQGMRIACFSNFSKLNLQDFKAVQQLLLFVPASCKYAHELLGLRTAIGNHVLVGILSNENVKYVKNTFDHLVPLDVPASQIRKIAEDLFEGGERSASEELTAREKEVLRLIALGNTNKVIADALYISTHTVISHRKNITEKLGIKSIPGLTVYAIIQKIVATSDISPDQLA